MDGVHHYLVDELEPFDEFHVVKFQEYAQKYLNEIYAHGKIPIITGGTGFYIQALLMILILRNRKVTVHTGKSWKHWQKNMAISIFMTG